MSGNLLVYDIIYVCDWVCVCVCEWEKEKESERYIVSKKNICMVLVISEKNMYIFGGM